MSEKKELFTDRRWRDPPAYKVTGKREVSPEEREEARRDTEVLLRKYGLLKEGEHLDASSEVTEEKLREMEKIWFPNEGKK